MLSRLAGWRATRVAVYDGEKAARPYGDLRRHCVTPRDRNLGNSADDQITQRTDSVHGK